ncbi:hypothetical protein LX36DRAFT_163272 [Colletotrichum falcatum]|nr:hypothetical protein LX36DRAFT_163272 [Colletotrichum falcatum]
MSPNTTFTNVPHLEGMKNTSGDNINTLDVSVYSLDGSSASEISSEAGSCIWVGGRDEEISGGGDGGGGDGGGDDAQDAGVRSN